MTLLREHGVENSTQAPRQWLEDEDILKLTSATSGYAVTPEVTLSFHPKRSEQTTLFVGLQIEDLQNTVLIDAAIGSSERIGKYMKWFAHYFSDLFEDYEVRFRHHTVQAYLFSKWYSMAVEPLIGQLCKPKRIGQDDPISSSSLAELFQQGADRIRVFIGASAGDVDEVGTLPEPIRAPSVKRRPVRRRA